MSTEKDMKQEVAELKLNGCATVRELKESCSNIPDCKGVYFVLRDVDAGRPKIKPQSPVEMHKGKPLAYPVTRLNAKWVDNTTIMYIGKTDSSLRQRIRTYMNFGKGKDSPHRGGRAIWQLPDADNLVIGWRITPPDESAREIENTLILDFCSRHDGKLPFANFTE